MPQKRVGQGIRVSFATPCLPNHCLEHADQVLPAAVPRQRPPQYSPVSDDVWIVFEWFQAGVVLFATGASELELLSYFVDGQLVRGFYELVCNGMPITAVVQLSRSPSF